MFECFHESVVHLCKSGSTSGSLDQAPYLVVSGKSIRGATIVEPFDRSLLAVQHDKLEEVGGTVVRNRRESLDLTKPSQILGHDDVLARA